MANDLDKWAKDRSQRRKKSAGSGAIDVLQKEAKKYGATLESDGHGGIDPKIALKVFRRFGYQCPRCGSRKNLTLHHKGGIVDSKKLDEMGHKTIQKNLATLCAECHDEIHEMARDKGIDSSQQTPKGDL